MREGINPGGRPIHGDPHDHAGIENGEGEYRESFDMGLRGYHESPAIISKRAQERQQKYPEGSSSLGQVVVGHAAKEVTHLKGFGLDGASTVRRFGREL